MLLNFAGLLALIGLALFSYSILKSSTVSEELGVIETPVESASHEVNLKDDLLKLEKLNDKFSKKIKILQDQNMVLRAKINENSGLEIKAKKVIGASAIDNNITLKSSRNSTENFSEDKDSKNTNNLKVEEKENSDVEYLKKITKLEYSNKAMIEELKAKTEELRQLKKIQKVKNSLDEPKETENKLEMDAEQRQILETDFITFQEKIKELERVIEDSKIKLVNNDKQKAKLSNLIALEQKHSNSKDEEIIKLTQVIKADNKNLALARAELNSVIKYRGLAKKLNGLKAIFTGSMVYSPKRNEIMFLTKEGIRISMMQDDFTGSLVGECGLPINDFDGTRCSVTILADLLFQNAGLFLKGKKIVSVIKD